MNAKVLCDPSVVNFMDGCMLALACHNEDEPPLGFSICGSTFADVPILARGGSVEALLPADTHAMSIRILYRTRQKFVVGRAFMAAEY